ncbi:two pore domain potassium channel family protein [Luteimonas aestuarii]|uniref:Two pore domain potassium channel family protein n=1 Tax=Luteimonas aestuarii TaxID=453837 RepID=A0A4R5U4I2_9GAMM|nr:potassium channel family protein [Luteimonas aestuarii]TDK28628.1 two pore domain potassium channel family protein [Luteimonas aestuarii]
MKAESISTGRRVTLYLLLGMLVHNLTYPLTGIGGVWPALFYLFYGVLFVAATWLLLPDRGLRMLAAGCGVAVIAAGLANSYAPGTYTKLGVFLTSIAYHAVITWVLVVYIFRATAVMADVLLAAASIYLVIGSGFAAIYGLVEWLSPGSFVTASGDPVSWQQLFYYSYVTLTTVGYGDILPQGFLAQSFAIFQAVVGVLYTAILLARLVGLQASPSPEAREPS